MLGLLSEEARELEYNKLGYRNILYANSGIYKLVDIISFEYNMLGNTDIFYTMDKLYNDYNIPKFARKIKYTINYLADKLNCKSSDLNGIWLATKNNVYKNYVRINEEPIIVEVNLDKLKNRLIISDLGEDGVLYVYTEIPYIVKNY